MKFPIKWKLTAIVIGAMVLVSVVGIVAAVSLSGREEYVYKETKVQFGTLVVGVTESGTVDIGTVEQTFDLDMTALQRVESSSNSGTNAGSGIGGGFGGMSGGMSSANGGMPGGMPVGNMSGGNVAVNMFDQIFSMSGGNNLSSTGEDSSLTISEVLVSVGQHVAEGDVLYRLEEESVSELETKLQSNVEKAKADLDAVYADQKLSRTTADYTYQSSLAYGDYAEAEYSSTVQELRDAVEKSRLTLERAKETLSDYKRQMDTLTPAYEDAAQVLKNCQYSLDQTSPDDVYGYVYYAQLTTKAQSSFDSLDQQKEQLERNLEQAQSNVETAQQSYQAAQRNLDQGLLDAEQTRSLRKLAYNTAKETYDITLAYLDEEAAAQETIYQETKEKWDEFSSHISGNSVCAQYNGVITSVDLAEGDSINTGTLLVSLYDMNDVSMTVTVYEEDMTSIAIGSQANIAFTAYPEEVFRAEVTYIADATTDNNGNVTYDVTVTIRGDVSGLFQGMTGDITFVTEQTENVLYVSRRAITVDGEKSYVKVREENGNVKRVQVTTGFTDGTNVQIVEGLSEGDIVLIESKVSGS